MLKFLSVCVLTPLILCFCFSLSPASLNLQLLGILEGENDGDRFGRSVGSLGDINGDGYEDFGVDAPCYSSYRGKVYIYFGGAELDTAADLTFEGKDPGSFLNEVIAVGDINKDSFADFAISSSPDPGPGYVYIYFGGETVDTVPDITLTGTLEYNNFDYFGTELASGDLNNDGYMDIAVGSNDIGHCSVFMGDIRSDTTPDYILTKNNHYYSIGGIVTGDMNGDLYHDLIVGSGQLQESYFYFGGESLNTEPDLIFGYLGKLVTEDFNGDEYEDLANPIGVHYGSSNMDTIVDICIGYSPLAGGHVNKDRFGDLITLGYDYGTLGSVYIYLGGADMDSVKDWFKVGQYGGLLGWAAVTADLNNDGVDEIIISEPGYFFGSDKGRVYAYSGDTAFVSVEDEEEEHILPHQLTLEQNYPNPFNTNTIIRYSLDISRATHTTLKIYNILGKEVRTLVDDWESTGKYQIRWNGKDNYGKEVASGIYFYRLRVGDRSETKKLLLLK
jgi:hypothetical protein